MRYSAESLDPWSNSASNCTKSVRQQQQTHTNAYEVETKRIKSWLWQQTWLNANVTLFFFFCFSDLLVAPNCLAYTPFQSIRANSFNISICLSYNSIYLHRTQWNALSQYMYMHTLHRSVFWIQFTGRSLVFTRSYMCYSIRSVWLGLIIESWCHSIFVRVSCNLFFFCVFQAIFFLDLIVYYCILANVWFFFCSPLLLMHRSNCHSSFWPD